MRGRYLGRGIAGLAACVALLAGGLACARDERTFELGVARFPENAPAAPVTWHGWADALSRRDYRVGFAYGEAAHEAVVADHARFARSLRFRRIGGSAFLWDPPPHCRGREWACVYREVRERSHVDLEPLFQRIRVVFEERSVTSRRAAEWLLAMVQRIAYREPERSAFGLLPPAQVAAEKWGDCDSKSLLLMGLLDHVDIDSVLLVSEAHAHAMVGIAVPAGRERFSYRGRRYAWAETTAEGAPLGWRHPRQRYPDDWRVVRIR